VNDAPIAANDAATTNEDTAVSVAVLGNDTDPDGRHVASRERRAHFRRGHHLSHRHDRDVHAGGEL
jgi:hypothetical protein